MKQRWNWHLCLSILIISCGGIPKGYDEGGYSSSTSLPSFERDFDLLSTAWKDNPSGLANRRGNVNSLAVLGAALGALISLYLNDRLGRLRMWRGAAVLWTSGLLMQMFASGIYGFLLFARIWSGIGAGALTVVTPLFLSEIAGAAARGKIVTCYMAMLLLWFTIGYFISYAAGIHLSNDSRLQYRVVQAIPLIPTGLAWLGSFAIPESPRWLVSKGRAQEAEQAMVLLRGDNSASVQGELHAMCEQQKKTEHGSSILIIAREIFVSPSLRSRILLAWIMQAVAQWSGGQGISYYIPQVFGFAGETSAFDDLILSGVYGIVKLAVTVLFALFFVDMLGRRPCFITGLTLQLLAHIYLSIYLGIQTHNNHANLAAGKAAIVAIFIYATGWSVGLCTVEFLYASEVFPTRHRSFATGSTVCIHWLFQFAVVRVTPVMFVSLRVWGAFVFFAAVCAVGLVVLVPWAPETKGVPLESMEELFHGKWYMGWQARVASGAKAADAVAVDGTNVYDAGLQGNMEVIGRQTKAAVMNLNRMECETGSSGSGSGSNCSSVRTE